MRFNFRKITSVLASAVMIGSTVGLAAAATVYPEPFVKSGVADAAIVYGASATLDLSAATDLGSKLGTKVSVTSGAISGEGDKIKLERSSSKLNVGQGFGYVLGTSITKSDLKTMLADGKFYNKQNSEYKYTQKFDLANLTFTHYSDSEFNDRKPTLGVKANANTYIANYTLEFVTNAESVNATDLTDFEQKSIQILGKNYYILDFKKSTAKITLLDAATSSSVVEGETSSITVGDKAYEVSVKHVASDEVILIVNGEATEKLSATGTTYGNTYKLSDGTYVGVKNINYNSKQGTVSNIDFSLGKGKLEITDATNVKINDKSVTDLYGHITLGNTGSGSSQKITWNKLAMRWQVEDKKFLAPGKDLIMPGFEAIKFTTTEPTISTKETTKVDYSSSDVIELKTTIKDGKVTIPLFFYSTTNGSISAIGKSATEKLATSHTTELVYNATSDSNSQWSTFVATWASTRDAQTYYLKAAVRYDSDGVRNLTTITNKVTGDILCEDKKAGDRCDIGNVALTINKVDYTSGGDRIVNMTIGSGGSFDILYTKDGLKLQLPYYNAGATDINGSGAINSTPGVAKTTWLTFTEEDKDGNLASGTTFNMTIDVTGTTSFKTRVNTVYGAGTQYETSSGSKIWESYVVSPLGTKVTQDKTSSDQWNAEMEYHGNEIYGNVWVAAPSVITGGAASIPVVKDSEVDSVKDKNLVVVGGSCINEVARKIVASDATAPVCEADWTAKSGVGAGQFILKAVASPYNSAKTAVLVAGYDAADTKKAVDKLVEGATTDVGTSKVYPEAAA